MNNEIYITKLDIHLMYTNEYNDFLFCGLVEGPIKISPFLELDLQDLASFYRNAHIGIEFVNQGIFSFCRQIGTGGLDYVSFLLDSIDYVMSEKSDSEIFRETRLEVWTNPNILKLYPDNEEKKFVIKFYHSERAVVATRRFRYFDQISVPYNIWIPAAVIALNEYFTMLKRLFENEYESSRFSPWDGDPIRMWERMLANYELEKYMNQNNA